MGDLQRLIAFDLDGTLVDSRRDLADSANQLIEELGGQSQPEAAIGRMVGEGAALLVRRALDAAGIEQRPDALPRFLDIYDSRLLNHTRLYDGIADVVRGVRGRARLTVLTNKPAAPSVRILDALGLLDAFDQVIGGDSPYNRKPDPGGLFAMMAAAQTSAAQTLLVGDSGVDLETARRAKVDCCLVAYGFGYRDDLAPWLRPGEQIVGDAQELGGVIEQFLRR